MYGVPATDLQRLAHLSLPGSLPQPISTKAFSCISHSARSLLLITNPELFVFYQWAGLHVTAPKYVVRTAYEKRTTTHKCWLGVLKCRIRLNPSLNFKNKDSRPYSMLFKCYLCLKLILLSMQKTVPGWKSPISHLHDSRIII